MQIRSIVILLLIGIFLIGIPVGCKSKEAETKNEESLDPEAQEGASTDYRKDKDYGGDENIIEDYRNMVRGDNEPFALIRFIDKEIKGVSQEDAVEMIIRLEDVQETYMDRYTEELFTEGYQMELLSLSQGIQSNGSKGKRNMIIDLFFDEDGIDDIKNGNLKELIQRLMEGKYRLINMEGAFYPIIDYEALKDYDDYLPKDIRDYIHIRAMGANKPIVIDAELQVTFDQLSEMLMDMEKYIRSYPSSKRHIRVLRLYEECLELYLRGSDNSPIFTESGLIRKDVRKSYRNVAKNKGKETSRIVGKYIDIIRKNRNRVDDGVLTKVLNLKKEAIYRLEQ